MNHKAQVFDVARKTIYWMFAGFIITLVVLFFVFALAGYRSKLTQVPAQLPAELISLRFTESPACFAYTDENGQVYPGRIDFHKFTNETLAKCYRTEGEAGLHDFNFRLKLIPYEKEVITNNYFYHENPDLTLSHPVEVQTEQGLAQGELIIYVQEKI